MYVAVARYGVYVRCTKSASSPNRKVRRVRALFFSSCRRWFLFVLAIRIRCFIIKPDCSDSKLYEKKNFYATFFSHPFFLHSIRSHLFMPLNSTISSKWNIKRHFSRMHFFFSIPSYITQALSLLYVCVR